MDYLKEISRILGEIQSVYPDMSIMQILDNAKCNIEGISDERMAELLNEYAYWTIPLSKKESYSKGT